MEKEKLTTAQAADFVKKSISTLRRDRKIRHLGIPFKKETVGNGRVFYLKADLVDWQQAIIETSTNNFNAKD